MNDYDENLIRKLKRAAGGAHNHIADNAEFPLKRMSRDYPKTTMTKTLRERIRGAANDGEWKRLKRFMAERW